MKMKAIVSYITFSNPMNYKQINDLVMSCSAAPFLFQIVHPSTVPNPNHLLFSVANALRRHAEHRNIAEHIGIETLLFLLQERQIHKAIKKAGIHQPTKNIYLVLFHDEETILHEIHRCLEANPEVKVSLIDFSGLTKTELAGIENIALFNLQA